MTRNEAYLTVVEGWLRDNRGIVFTEGAVDDLCDRIASVLADNGRLRAENQTAWNKADELDERARHAEAALRRALEPKP